jgi:hypothetical protein
MTNFAEEVEDLLAMVMAENPPGGDFVARRSAAARIVAALYTGSQVAEAEKALAAVEPQRLAVVRDFVNGDKIA